MNAKNTKKSLIHENADANITCDFGDSDISPFRSRLPHGHIVSAILVRYNDVYMYKHHSYSYMHICISQISIIKISEN